MRAVLQRVSRAAVSIAGAPHSQIGPGLLILLGVEKGDSAADAAVLARKSVELRIFQDDAGKMNRSVLETGGEILAVSQFTLAGDCRRGRRPSFDDAAPPAEARELCDRFVREVEGFGVQVSTGVFQADMAVELVNQGPVTFILDSRKRL